MVGVAVGKFRLLRKLGEGGMGVVYVAEHELLGNQVAVKLLLPEVSQNQEIVQRFFNEARAATRIKHPGIVQVFDFGYADSGAAYFAMELMDGQSLADRLRAGRLGFEEAAGIGRQIAGALAAAHGQGIVHRDLKPDNVFLVPDGDMVGGVRVKVLDFGIAKLAAEANVASVKTRTGSVMGTPYYMSPEQCRGAGEVDHRADIYSLGCILFEAVCGRPPFQGEGLGQILGAHQYVPPPPVRTLEPRVPAALETTIMRALEKEPGARPQTMSELARSLEPLAPRGSGPIAVPSPRVTAPDTRPPVMAAMPAPTVAGGRGKGLLVGLGALALAGAAALIYLFAVRGSQPTRDQASPSPAPVDTEGAEAMRAQPEPPQPAPLPAPPQPTPPSQVEVYVTVDFESQLIPADVAAWAKEMLTAQLANHPEVSLDYAARGDAPGFEVVATVADLQVAETNGVEVTAKLSYRIRRSALDMALPVAAAHGSAQGPITSDRIALVKAAITSALASSVDRDLVPQLLAKANGTLAAAASPAPTPSPSPSSRYQLPKPTAKPTPKLSVGAGSAAVKGGLEREIIRRVIRRHLAKFQYCYEKELARQPGLQGTVSTQFMIDASGSVQSAHASGVSPTVANCVASALSGIKFPKPAGGGLVNVSYPFIFRAAGN